jgi:hypothetical protein
MRCGFCGLEFDIHQAEQACGACPLVKGCHLVRCPRCGYEMPPEGKLVGWLGRLKQKSKPELKRTTGEEQHAN